MPIDQRNPFLLLFLLHSVLNGAFFQDRLVVSLRLLGLLAGQYEKQDTGLDGLSDLDIHPSVIHTGNNASYKIIIAMIYMCII